MPLENDAADRERELLEQRLLRVNEDLSIEERRKKRLEDELNDVRKRALSKDPELAAITDRVTREKARLELEEAEYARNLEVLADLRKQIDEARMRRNAKPATQSQVVLSVCHDAGHGAWVPTPAPPPVHVEPIRLTSAERMELQTFQRDLERFHSKWRHKQVELVEKTERFRRFIDDIFDGLGINSVVELFAEAERLEKENTELYTVLRNHEAEAAQLQREMDGLHEAIQTLEQESAEKAGAEAEELARLETEVADANQRLAEIVELRTKEETEFVEVFDELERLFNCLELSWEENPDGTTNISRGNVEWALNCIEDALRDLEQRGELPSALPPSASESEFGAAKKPGQRQ